MYNFVEVYTMECRYGQLEHYIIEQSMLLSWIYKKWCHFCISFSAGENTYKYSLTLATIQA